MRLHEILERNRAAVAARLARAAADAGRDPAEVRLLAVTKSVTPEVARALASLGQLDLGENRLPQLEEKHAFFTAHPLTGGAAVRWHFVGHLQRNKARRVVRLADEIHSVDSAQLVETLERVAAEEDRRPRVWLQVNAAGEERKHGLAPGEVAAVAELAGAAPHLELCGLMAMAPLEAAEGGAAGEALARRTFDDVAALARGLGPGLFAGGAPRLSMGMSGDLEAAIAAGSHVVRVGRALFEGLREEAPGGGR